MPRNVWVNRDGSNNVNGVYGRPQSPGMADEKLSEDHADVQTYYNSQPTPPETKIVEGATTTSGKVTITPTVNRKVILSSIRITIQRKTADTGTYAWCLSDAFASTGGGDILVYNELGVGAPDGTLVHCKYVEEDV